ncbi:MAG: hypothetical protein EBX30_10175 [Betaproteobacteria bacterium]|nr:hypothetical protein [Betaproteobacteria bacterium]NCY07544.1 hypothetical protein [Betaproteobacteria bacterium]NDE53032.1 hypothetical protein [Actinomycetota bacterium]
MKYLRTTIVSLSCLLIAGCFESMPKLSLTGDSPLLPASPALKDRNAALARAWDQSSLNCRVQFNPRGGFCEQLKTEGEFLQCAATRLTDAAEKLRYPAPDLIRVWHNCVMSTASLLRDGYYLTKPEIEKRVSACQAKLDPEPEFPVRQSGWLGPVLTMLTTEDKEPLRAVMPGDFGVANSRIALPTCEARFKPIVTESRQTPLAEKLSEEAVVAKPVSAPALSTAPAREEEAEKKPQAKRTVNTRDAKVVSARPSSGKQAPVSADPRSSQGLAATYCPIPGACGPTVPADAVKRP